MKDAFEAHKPIPLPTAAPEPTKRLGMPSIEKPTGRWSKIAARVLGIGMILAFVVPLVVVFLVYFAMIPSSETQARERIQSIERACKAFHLDNDRFPNNLKDLTI